VSDAQRQAVSLAQHYFRLLAQHAGVRWEADNDTEVELMVSFIIDAAAAGLGGQLDGALDRIRRLEAAGRGPVPDDTADLPRVRDDGMPYRGWLP
jgi:hypothetical protein